MKDYFKRLKTHPGISMAVFMTILGFLFGGGTNKSLYTWLQHGLFGALCMGVLAWSIVLISNIKIRK